MGIAERTKLYRQVEERRKRPLIVYVTSTRVNANGMIAGDSVPEFLAQLQLLPRGTKELDLLIVSDGGDPTVAWRIVSMIRQRVTKFSALIPQAAFSAATLIVMGADEVVMHPNGNLGPTDPQIRVPRRNQRDGGTEVVGFGSEDLMAFLRFTKDQVGLKDPQNLTTVFLKFCDEATAMGVGVAARSSLLGVALGEKLLQQHMLSDGDKAKAKEISEKLTKDFFHHGYPVNRSEARDIGLKVAGPDEELEELMWKIWTDLSDELKLREPHSPLRVLAENPACKPLFAPIPHVTLPANLPLQIAQQAHQQILAQINVAHIPPAPFELIHAVCESARLASRFVTDGFVVGTKTPDHQIRMSSLTIKQMWTTLPKLGATEGGALSAAKAADPGAPAERVAKAPSRAKAARSPRRGTGVKKARKSRIKR